MSHCRPAFSLHPWEHGAGFDLHTGGVELVHGAELYLHTDGVELVHEVDLQFTRKNTDNWILSSFLLYFISVHLFFCPSTRILREQRRLE